MHPELSRVRLLQRALFFFFTQRRKLWPAVWCLLFVILYLGSLLSWEEAIIVAALPTAAYVILAYSSPETFRRIRLQFTMRHLCIAVGLGGPILAVLLQAPSRWVDWHHQRVLEHGDIQFYSKIVNQARYGMSDMRDYAIAVSLKTMQDRETLTSREFRIEIEVLRELGNVGHSIDLLLEIVRSPDEKSPVRLEAIRSLDAFGADDSEIRHELLDYLLQFAGDCDRPTEERVAALRVLSACQSFKLSPRLVHRVLPLAIQDDDSSVREAAILALDSLELEAAVAERGLRHAVALTLDQNTLRKLASASQVISKLNAIREPDAEEQFMAPELIERLSTPQTRDSERALLCVLEAMQVFDAISPLESLLLESPEPDRERVFHRVQALCSLVQGRVLSDKSGDISGSLQPLVNVAALSRAAESKAIELIESLAGVLPDSDSQVELLTLAVQLRGAWHVQTQLIDNVRRRNSAETIRRLLKISLTSATSSVRLDTALTAAEMLQSQNTDDEELMKLMAEWICLADTYERAVFCKKLSGARKLNERLFTAVLDCLELQVDPEAEIPSPIVVDAFPKTVLTEDLQAMLADDDVRVRDFAARLASLRANVLNRSEQLLDVTREALATLNEDQSTFPQTIRYQHTARVLGQILAPATRLRLATLEQPASLDVYRYVLQPRRDTGELCYLCKHVERQLAHFNSQNSSDISRSTELVSEIDENLIDWQLLQPVSWLYVRPSPGF